MNSFRAVVMLIAIGVMGALVSDGKISGRAADAVSPPPRLEALTLTAEASPVPTVRSFSAHPAVIGPGEAVSIEIVIDRAAAAEVVGWHPPASGPGGIIFPLGTWAFDGSVLRGVVVPEAAGRHTLAWLRLRGHDGAEYFVRPAPRGTLPTCPAMGPAPEISALLTCGWDTETVGSGQFELRPVVEIAAKPVGGPDDTPPSFEFGYAPALSARPFCRLDGGSQTACQSPVTLPELAPGLHVLEVEVYYSGATPVPVAMAYGVRAFFVGERGPTLFVPNVASDP